MAAKLKASLPKRQPKSDETFPLCVRCVLDGEGEREGERKREGGIERGEREREAGRERERERPNGLSTYRASNAICIIIKGRNECDSQGEKR